MKTKGKYQTKRKRRLGEKEEAHSEDPTVIEQETGRQNVSV